MKNSKVITIIYDDSVTVYSSVLRFINIHKNGSILYSDLIAQRHIVSTGSIEFVFLMPWHPNFESLSGAIREALESK